MSELILHHYDEAPFAEKIRMVLGIKQLTWHSVIVPSAMPKPDLIPLTGGYRRTPRISDRRGYLLRYATHCELA